ncbi:hypothetical protein [Halosegnis longus]|uniref:Cyclic nucleotide-binding domain-containing protein n=1 Tax=Halosegnis longus TaxID=2216012 RepID=A0AAJ4R8F5_9EURY|nr:MULTISPECIES: hypothetical protein [Halobacteriales]RNJ26398.1 hypothetical protein Nmn1133_06775 [Salella cibi]
MKQLSRTTLEYNSNDADFQHLWDFANIVKTMEIKSGTYVIDSGIENDDYDGIFEGSIAVYEIEDESVVDAVWDDQAGEYDNFGQVYDELAKLAER